MTTFQSLAHLCTCVQVLQAYRTTPVQTLRPADVVVHQIHAQATSAAVAVEEVVRAAHPTDPAVRAMERTDAHVVVEERTFQAGIQPELGSATHTVVRLGLLQTAHCALDLRHMGRLQLVGLRQILSVYFLSLSQKQQHLVLHCYDKQPLLVYLPCCINRTRKKNYQGYNWSESVLIKPEN
eukprot:TRINITY_DN4688_c1_g1_i2.p6 TRINITY_DN4688_c1_g1~~TRINITY_DN4688_c1_g1_i2.p6  ORF type:complete len:181 (+),score=5.51 TRINITY_DN4688_c1_g1_i2:1848-2390(+)